jgi:hypothetical protein
MTFLERVLQKAIGAAVMMKLSPIPGLGARAPTREWVEHERKLEYA